MNTWSSRLVTTRLLAHGARRTMRVAITFATAKSIPRRAVLRVLVFILLLAGLMNTKSWGDSAPNDRKSEGRLTHASLEELGEIEVTTTSKEPVKASRTPAATYVITQEDIRRSGATSIAEALRLAPGVEVARVDSNTWSLGVRGFGSALSRSVLVLIDGRTVYTPLFAGVYWQG